MHQLWDPGFSPWQNSSSQALTVWRFDRAYYGSYIPGSWPHEERIYLLFKGTKTWQLWNGHSAGVAYTFEKKKPPISAAVMPWYRFFPSKKSCLPTKQWPMPSWLVPYHAPVRTFCFYLFSSWGNCPPQSYWSLSCDHGRHCCDEVMWQQQQYNYNHVQVPCFVTTNGA